MRLNKISCKFFSDLLISWVIRYVRFVCSQHVVYDHQPTVVDANRHCNMDVQQDSSQPMSDNIMQGLNDLDCDGTTEICNDKKVIVGICAMAKKSNSKPMREILTRMEEFEYIKTIIFPEEVILKVMFSLLTGSLKMTANSTNIPSFNT